jgi:hypothetical protein
LLLICADLFRINCIIYYQRLDTWFREKLLLLCAFFICFQSTSPGDFPRTVSYIRTNKYKTTKGPRFW